MAWRELPTYWASQVMKNSPLISSSAYLDRRSVHAVVESYTPASL